MSRNRRRGASTSAAIEDAALELALERGYEKVTVGDICAQVGISQRAFFNHFPTKDDALLGRDLPKVDEKAARRFVISDAPLLTDAISLITQDFTVFDEEGIRQRMRVIASSPSLMARQMERIGAVEEELVEIILLRVCHQDPTLSVEDATAQATMTAHLLAGIFRFISSQAIHERDLASRIEYAKHALEMVLTASTPQANPILSPE